MPTYIQHIEPLLPDYSFSQQHARDRMISWMPGKRNQRLLKGIYDRSGIDTRHSVLPDFGPDTEPVLFHKDAAGHIVEPTTQQRNRYYTECSRKMVIEAGRRSLENAAGFEASDCTHVITVSCTGFYNPGPDYDLIRGLGLPESTERYNLGFMGCYAAFPALRMADQFCQARPDSVVLIICLEFCSLHMQLREETDSMLGNSLFADGAAAVIVSARKPDANRPALAMQSFSSALATEGVGDMAWEIGDRGFDLRLSTYVPNIIAENIRPVVAGVLEKCPWNVSDIARWAVHPGGRSILDKVENELELSPEQLADSRDILRRFGNMSSVTVLFVLHQILNHTEGMKKLPVCAMAFGPGLTIESALLEWTPPST